MLHKARRAAQNRAASAQQQHPHCAPRWRLQDGLTYLVAAFCAWQLPASLGVPGAQPGGGGGGGGGGVALKRRQSDRALAGVELAELGDSGDEEEGEEGRRLLEAAGLGEAEAGRRDGARSRQGGEVQLLPASAGGWDATEQRRAARRHTAGGALGAGGEAAVGSGQQRQGVQGAAGEVPRAATHDSALAGSGRRGRRSPSPFPLRGPRLKDSDAEEAPSGAAATSAPPAPHAAASGQHGAASAMGGAGAGTAAGGVLAAAGAAAAEAARAAWEGCAYLCSPQNRDVAALVAIKGCGSLVWGAVDVLQAGRPPTLLAGPAL